MNGSDRQFKRAAVAAAVDDMRQRSGKARDTGVSRRKFLQAGAVTAALGTLPWLASCGGGDDGTTQPARPTELRTIFFNHTHLDHAGKQMFFHVGMKVYSLRPIAEAPDVLARERQNNGFLAAVADEKITHVVEDVEIDPDYTGFGYVSTATTGAEWTMDGIHMLLPEKAATLSYERALQKTGGKTPQASLKRQKYGIQAAGSGKEVHEEQALNDTVSQSQTLIAMHKDMLGLDAGAAGTVVNNYVANSDAAFDLDDTLAGLDTAHPPNPDGSANTTGWASLRPVINKNTGQPFTMTVNTSTGPQVRNVYMPVLHPDVAKLVGQGVTEVLPLVQDDSNLGADVTSRPAGSSLAGVLWTRQDGTPTVVQSGAMRALQANQAPAMAVSWPNGQNHWLDCSATITPVGGGVQQLTVNYSNTGLRYLSCFVEFEDDANPPNLIPMSQMPGWFDQTWVSSPPNFGETYSPGEDGTKTRLPIGGIQCIGTVMGIPVFTDSNFYGSLGITMKLPSSVHKVRLFAGGLGAGSNNYSDTIAGGVAATMLMNYVMTTLFAALGAIPNMDAVFSLVTNIVGTFIFDLAAALADKYSGNDLLSSQFWIDQGMNLINLVIGMFTTYAVSPAIEKFAEGLTEIIGLTIAEEAVKNAIIVVGIALNIESALSGAADIALTTVQIAQSPFTYVTELEFTHDVTVAINMNLHDDTHFPLGANVFQVTATFDDGKPWKSDWLPNPGGTTTSYTFKGVPFGGNVQFDCVFVQRALDGSDADNVLLGSGSSAKLANDDSTAYSLTVDELSFPIGITTTYQHQKRTYLNASNQHVWVTEGRPTALPATFQCGSAGEICLFNGIAVRQGNINGPTMLAYAWHGQNAAGGGDVDQTALIDFDHPSTVYSVNTLPPGTVGGLTLAVSRAAGGTNNYYVDATGAVQIIRAVNFPASGSPTLDGPGSNRAFGVLNAPSSALLVHPSGVLVSVSGTKQRIEILNPPDQPVTDDVAGTNYIAQVLGVPGAGIGRMNSVVGATITNDGTLLVLEGGVNNRIQAFDLSANPARYFANAPTPYFLPLTGFESATGWRHLDVQADFTGLIYLLLFNQISGVYQLAVYDSLSKLQQPLMMTEGIYAARIGLDHWRNLFTMNYQPITVQGTGAAPAITEPSVSLWTPCNQGTTCQTGLSAAARQRAGG